MAIFNSYVSLPEGIQNSIGNRPVPSNLKVLTSMVVEKNVKSKKSLVEGTYIMLHPNKSRFHKTQPGQKFVPVAVARRSRGPRRICAKPRRTARIRRTISVETSGPISGRRDWFGSWHVSVRHFR
jgi:hypothetical protein